MYVSAIVLAAGRGVRLKSKTPKPLIKINSKPVLIYSLATLSKNPWIKEIIVVVNPLNQKKIIHEIKQRRIKKVKKIILGGNQRRDSVYRGLRAINKAAGLVLIHDGARPFVDAKTISLVINEAGKTGAAIVGVPVKATIKEVRGSGLGAHGKYVKKTLDRENLWEIQTPQVFKKDIILEADVKFGKTKVTDDAMLVEK